MRSTSFGNMVEGELPFPVEGIYEVMNFQRKGSLHQHGHREVAICTFGSGHVWVGDEKHSVSPGEYVVIPPDTPHYMDPAVAMTMLILYEAGESPPQ